MSVQQPPNTDYAYVTLSSDESPLAVLAQGQCQVVEGRSVEGMSRFEPRKPYSPRRSERERLLPTSWSAGPRRAQDPALCRGQAPVRLSRQEVRDATRSPLQVAELLSSDVYGW